MTEDPSAEIAAFVLAAIQGAAQAMSNQDIEGVVRCLKAAVALYEQHPTCAQQPVNHLRDLLVYIRSARSLCETLGRPYEDLRVLEARAATLRGARLH